jgi:nucleoside-diphosphate-sugar epimerase
MRNDDPSRQPIQNPAPTDTKPSALVIGATGGIGGEMARLLLRRGWQVRALTRRLPPPTRPQGDLAGIDWVTGDAMIAADVLAAAAGCQLIVHGANPPGYRDWENLARPMLQNSIDAAKAHDARLLFPGTVYNFGPDAMPDLTEHSPQHPLTRKGKIRVAMEQMLKDAAAQGVRSLIVRAGDFFGPRAGNNWFSQCLVKPGKPVRSVTYPGDLASGHAWAHLPDLAETMMQLVEREADLATCDVFHFAGHWLARGDAMTAAIRQATRDVGIKHRRFFWPAIYLAAPVNTFCREVLEMRYLWQREVRLDNSKLQRFLGTEPHTPLTDAVRQSLIGLGAVEIHRELMTAEHSRIIAAKL